VSNNKKNNNNNSKNNNNNSSNKTLRRKSQCVMSSCRQCAIHMGRASPAFAMEAAISFGVFRTSVRRRQRRQKEEELLIGLRESIGRTSLCLMAGKKSTSYLVIYFSHLCNAQLVQSAQSALIYKRKVYYFFFRTELVLAVTFLVLVVLIFVGWDSFSLFCCSYIFQVRLISFQYF